jgi:site-specific recombinase XerD
MEKLNLIQFQSIFCEHLEKSGKSFNTIKNYKTDLNIFNQFLISRGRMLVINEITVDELNDYNHFLEKKYNSPNSIRRRVQALRLFFDFLMAKGFYDENPVKKIIVKPKVVDLPNPPGFNIVRKLVIHLENKIQISSDHEKMLYMRNLILVHLIYGGALKVSDIERLHKAHINETKGLMRVLIAPNKRDPYTVAMPKESTDIFNTYALFLEQRKSSNKVDFDNFLFNANPFKILKGGLSARGIEVIFKEFSNSIEFNVTAKSLRQACIFKWLGQQMSEARIKEWMGVQPAYSLKPYKELLEAHPADFCFLEI